MIIQHSARAKTPMSVLYPSVLRKSSGLTRASPGKLLSPERRRIAESGNRLRLKLSLYGSTKFAIEGITEALHAELKLLGIHATVMEPGFFRPIFWTQALSCAQRFRSTITRALLGALST
jgi:NAD(P)-dependent dehydrogenase (short-subunit alcohol dehydrogenase family)